MPEPRPDLAAIRERLHEYSRTVPLHRPQCETMARDHVALLARCEELEAALREIVRLDEFADDSGIGLDGCGRIASKALAAAQEEPNHE